MDGTVGIIFRFQDYYNYYTFEIGGERKKFIQLKKNVLGKFTVLQKVDDRGYEAFKWYQVKLYVAGSQIKVFFNEAEAASEEAMSVEDEELKEGTIGFSTFRTPCGFDKIKIHPLGDLPEEGLI